MLLQDFCRPWRHNGEHVPSFACPFFFWVCSLWGFHHRVLPKHAHVCFTKFTNCSSVPASLLPHLLNFYSWKELHLHSHGLHLLFELVLEHIKLKRLIKCERWLFKDWQCQPHWHCGWQALGGSPETWFLYLCVFHIAEQTANTK